jgi:hypothetical protein
MTNFLKGGEIGLLGHFSSPESYKFRTKEGKIEGQLQLIL